MKTYESLDVLKLVNLNCYELWICRGNYKAVGQTEKPDKWGTICSFDCIRTFRRSKHLTRSVRNVRNWLCKIVKNFCSSSAFCLSALKMRVDAIKEGNRLTIKGDASIGLSARIFSNTGIFSKVRFASIFYSKFHFNLNINNVIVVKFA